MYAWARNAAPTSLPDGWYMFDFEFSPCAFSNYVPDPQSWEVAEMIIF